MAVYLVDTGCFLPPEELRVNCDDIDDTNFWHNSFLNAGATEEEAISNLAFQKRVFDRSGITRDGTYLPKSIHPILNHGQPKTDYSTAYDECLMCVSGAVEDLLKKTGLKPRDVDILVTTCSIYVPTPSMASMVVNKFKMRSDIHSYHLGGMGCSNGVVAVNLIHDILHAHPNSNAILVTNETLTPAFYRGIDPHRLVGNTLFRMAAAAVLMSNKRSWKTSGKAKYVLQRQVRVHNAANDDAYRCIWLGPDSKGIMGTYLGKNVVAEASKSLTQAMVKIGPYALSWEELARVGVNMVKRRLGSPEKRYNPSFSSGIDIFLIHAGGAKVLDGIGSALRLEEGYLTASRAVLHDYGNISSSSTWYTLAFAESCQGVRQGDRIMQVGVGSGVKCGVNIWKALREIDDVHEIWRHRVGAGHKGKVKVVRPSINVNMVFALMVILGAMAATWVRFPSLLALP